MELLKFFKSLSDETRLKIIAILRNGEFSVQEIVFILNMGQSRISRHLKILTDAGVTRFRREGSHVYYQINEDMESVRRSVIDWIGESDLQADIEPLIRSVLEGRREKSLRFFDREGERWRRLRNRFIDENRLYSAIEEETGELLTDRDRVVVDLGCGAGEILSILSSYSRCIIGVDNSREMLNAAAEYLKKAGRKDVSVDLRLGNLEHLPLGDAEADYVVASLVLHHLAQPSVVFPELWRIVKPGGMVLIAELCRHENEKAAELMADLWLGFSTDEITSWLIQTGFGIRKRLEYRSDNPFLPFMIIIAEKEKGEMT